MSRELLEEIADIKDKELYILFNELMLSNRLLGVELMLKLPENRELYHEDLQYHLQKGIAISQLIKERPLIELEDYFLTNASIFCGAVQHESYEVANEVLKELLYFQHVFLREPKCRRDKESRLARVRLHYKTLGKVIENCDQERLVKV